MFYGVFFWGVCGDRLLDVGCVGFGVLMCWGVFL